VQRGDEQVQRAVAAGCHREPARMCTEQGIELVWAAERLAAHVGAATAQHGEHLLQHALVRTAGLGVRDDQQVVLHTTQRRSIPLTQIAD
jgi:hypothetical protein